MKRTRTAITTAVRAVGRGETWLSAAVTARLINNVVRDPGEHVPPALSEREQDVLRLLALGKENQEIGDRLGISERTVRYHLRNIYDKLGVQRRGEAIAWAVRQRLDKT